MPTIIVWNGFRLLELPFTTLFEYLWLLRTICERFGSIGLGSKAMLYLAAAVSDFYIPKDQVWSRLCPSFDWLDFDRQKIILPWFAFLNGWNVQNNCNIKISNLDSTFIMLFCQQSNMRNLNVHGCFRISNKFIGSLCYKTFFEEFWKVLISRQSKNWHRKQSCILESFCK